MTTNLNSVDMAYPQCNSYFVESYTQNEILEREKNDKAIERYIKKQQQLVMAEELEELARAEYYEDHLVHMEQMEVCALYSIFW